MRRRFAGEAPGDAGSVDPEPSSDDASRTQDASEARDGIASEAASDASRQDAQLSLCPTGQATCSDIDLCVKQIAASPPQGVVATDEAKGVDTVRRLLTGSSSKVTASQITSGACEFVGGDGHPYAFISVDDGNVWLIVDGDVAPAVYDLVIQYIQCGCAQGRCEPQDAAAGG